MSFGERLAALRKAHGMTQQDLGRGLGTGGVDVGKQVIHGWERGQHFPRVDQLMLICQRLRCSSDFLLFGEQSAKLKVAQQVVADLTDEERIALFARIQGEPAPDSKVEAHYPPAPDTDAEIYNKLLKAAKTKPARKKAA